MNQPLFIPPEESILTHLENMFIFHPFNREELLYLLPFFKLDHFHDNAVLIAEGDVSDNKVYFLLSGKVSVFVNDRFILSLDHPEDIIGEMSLVSDAPRSATVKADPTARCLVLDAATAWRGAGQNSIRMRYYLSRMFNNIMSMKLRVTSDRAKMYETELQSRKRAEDQLRLAHQETIIRLMRVAEYRDNETGFHVQRMSHFCERLAQLARLPIENQKLIRVSSAMHDIGKIGIPDNILLKPGKLDPEEFEVMRQHTIIGYNIMKGSGVPLLDMAAQIAHDHHEKYDGTGYPAGLKAEAIPMESRITAVCDVFDALTSKRPYKPAMSTEEALGFLKTQSGTHFDPDLVDLFIQNVDQFLVIQERFNRGQNQEELP